MASSYADRLIEEHLERAYKYAATVAQVHRYLEDCDVRSAVHLALVRAASGYCAREGTFWAYARHYVRGAVKDLARKPRMLCLHGLDHVFFAPLDNVEPRIVIRQLLSQLPERGRSVLVGYDLEGHTLQQIALHLGISASHVSKIRRDMLGKLRKRRCTPRQSNIRGHKDETNETRQSWT